MNTPTDALLDGLVGELSRETGERWERWHAWGVKATLLVKGRPWNWGHEVSLMEADADPARYVAMVVKQFSRDLEAAKSDT